MEAARHAVGARVDGVTAAEKAAQPSVFINASWARRVASYITPQLRHLFDQCATKHRHKAREAGLAALGSAGASHCSNTTSPCTAPHATRKHTPSPRALRVD